MIPARGGSKGIFRKNLQLVGGRPLVSYAIEHALAAATVNQVVVSTEDAEIARVAQAWGADVPFTRPAELAQDHVSLIPVLVHAVQAMDELEWNATVVVSLQPTAPLLCSQTIDAGVKKLLETECDSVVSVRRVDHNHPYRIQRMDNASRITPLFPEGELYLQRQELPPFYAFSGGLYIRRRQLLEDWSEKDFCLGVDRRAVEVDDQESLNIDSPHDLALFRARMEEFLSKS